MILLNFMDDVQDFSCLFICFPYKPSQVEMSFPSTHRPRRRNSSRGICAKATAETELLSNWAMA